MHYLKSVLTGELGSIYYYFPHFMNDETKDHVETFAAEGIWILSRGKRTMEGFLNMEATQSGFHKTALAGVRKKDWQGTRLEVRKTITKQQH